MMIGNTRRPNRMINNTDHRPIQFMNRPKATLSNEMGRVSCSVRGRLHLLLIIVRPSNNNTALLYGVHRSAVNQFYPRNLMNGFSFVGGIEPAVFVGSGFINGR